MTRKVSPTAHGIVVLLLVGALAPSGLLAVEAAVPPEACRPLLGQPAFPLSGVVAFADAPLGGIDVVATPNATSPGTSATCRSDVTDGDGAYSLDLSEGCWQVSALDAAGTYRPQTSIVCMHAPRELDWSLFTTDPRETFVVSVAHGVTGAPLAGASVTYGFFTSCGQDACAFVTPEGAAGTSASTNADGEAVLRVIPGVDAAIRVTASGFVTHDEALPADGTREPASAATDGGRLSARGPIPLFPTPSPLSIRAEDILEDAPVAGAAVGAAHGFPDGHPYEADCSTNADGECVLVLPPGNYEVTVSGADRPARTHEATVPDTTDLLYRLDRDRVRYTGTVVDWTGGSIVPSDGDEIRLEGYDTRLPPASLGSDGVFTSDAQWGEWVLRADANGHYSQSLDLSLPPGSETAHVGAVRLLETEKAGLDVVVLLNGFQHSGAPVTVDGVEAGTTDDAGTLAMVMDPGTYELCASHEGVEACTLTTLVEGMRATSVISITVTTPPPPPPPTTLMGTVVEKDVAKPVEGTTSITVTDGDGAELASTTTSTGAFTFKPLPATTVRVSASNACYGGEAPVEATLPANATTTLDPLKLARLTLGSYEVSMRDATSGAGIAGRTVTVANVDLGNLAFSATTGPDGVAVFHDIPWGAYTVTLPASVTNLYVTTSVPGFTVACDDASGELTPTPAAIDLGALARRPLARYAVEITDNQTNVGVTQTSLSTALVTLTPLDGAGAVATCAYQGDAARNWTCTQVPWGNYTLDVDVPPASAPEGRGYFRSEDVFLDCVPVSTKKECVSITPTVHVDHSLGTLEVTVVSKADGTPVADALVGFSKAWARHCAHTHAAAQSPCTSAQILNARAVPMSPGAGCFFGAEGGVETVCSATTDADGVATLVLPWGDYALTASHPDYHATDLAVRAGADSSPSVAGLPYVAGGTVAQATLEADPVRVPVVVSVVDENASPIPGLTVSAAGEACTGAAEGSAYAVTDASGRAEFTCTTTSYGTLNGEEPAAAAAVALAKTSAFAFVVASPPEGYTNGAAVAVVGPALRHAGGPSDDLRHPTITLHPGPAAPECVGSGPQVCAAEDGTTPFSFASTLPTGDPRDPIPGEWVVQPPNLETGPSRCDSALECAGEFDGPADGTWIVAFAPEAEDSNSLKDYVLAADLGGATAATRVGSTQGGGKVLPHPTVWILNVVDGEVASHGSAHCTALALRDGTDPTPCVDTVALAVQEARFTTGGA